MNDTPAVAVVFDAPAVTPKVQAHWYHYVAAFLWNLYRKPMVWKRQRELDVVLKQVRSAVALEILPALQKRAMNQNCECRLIYRVLAPMNYLSQIELALKSLKCPDHPNMFGDFHDRYLSWFQRSEEIARWINGL